MKVLQILKNWLINLSNNEVENWRQRKRDFVKMFVIAVDVCSAVLVCFLVKIVLTNSNTGSMITKYPETKPFFEKTEWVDDFYKGHLYNALLKAKNYDLIFLMLYAPWDADSQIARSEFETACRFFGKKVFCAAVNCWHSNGGCTRFFGDIVEYPLFAADLRNIPVVRYTGEYKSSHMIQFLLSMLNPLIRISSPKSFWDVRGNCDALILSYVPSDVLLRTHSTAYKEYHSASVRYLELDPRRDLCWSIITDIATSQYLGLNEFQTKLYLWNETMVHDKFPSDMDVIKWTKKNVQFLTRWLFFRAAEPTLLSSIIENHPTVILFTPRNMLLENNTPYNLLREAAFIIRTCGFKQKLKEFHSAIVRNRQRMLDEITELENSCKNRFVNNNVNDIKDMNLSYFFTETFDVANTTCMNYTSHSNDNSNVVFNDAVDKRSPEHLVLLNYRESCRKYNQMKKIFNYTYYSEKLNEVKGKHHGVYCHMHYEFKFIAIDSLLYSHFATSLGINLNNFQDRTAVVIFSNWDESTFLLPMVLSDTEMLLQFILDFNFNNLSRWLKSTVDASLFVGRYMPVQNIGNFSITEVNSGTFLHTVFNHEKTVVVYYYTTYCGYCQTKSFVFLTVAYLFQNETDIIFVRVDASNNDLPWHLVPQEYPNVILFPADGKPESKVFPKSLEFNVTNLYNFISSNIQSPKRKKTESLETSMQEKNNEHYKEELQSHCVNLVIDLLDLYVDVVTERLESSSASFPDTIVETLETLESACFMLPDFKNELF